MMFSLAKKTTLIVEDFAEFARSVRGMINTMGAAEIDIVNNAEDALKNCSNKKYDIILSDYNLGPKKDGQQLFEELKVNHLMKSNCVFMMLTAENTTAMVMGALEFQPDGYIAKPFNGSILKSRLQKTIEKKDILLPISRSMTNKKWHEALENIRVVMSEHPKYKMACLRSQITAYIKIKKYDFAMEIASQLVAKRPMPWAMLDVGEILYHQKEHAKAIELFKKMIAEFPMALDAYDWLAKIQREVGQPVDAQETLTNAVKKSPKALERQRHLGQLAEENNDIPTMTKAYRNAVKQSKNSAFGSPTEYVKLSKALISTMENDPKASADKIKAEAFEVFSQLDKTFSSSKAAKLRSCVAQAAFSHATGDEKEMSKHLEKVNKLHEQLDEHIAPEDSIEIFNSLSNLGNTQLADEILNEVIKQNMDNTQFMHAASKISSNQDLIKISKQANQLNTKAINLFKTKKFDEAISHFEKASELSPSNINICLNYVQSLLKVAKTSPDPRAVINTANDRLSHLPNIGPFDPRFSRFSELNRLTKLMKQKLDG